MDVHPQDPLAWPLFFPLLGFQSISSPELTLDTQDVKEVNWPYTRKLVKGGTVSSITLTRGVQFFEADFYKWIAAAAMGDTGGLNKNSDLWAVGARGGVTYRRTMVLIQFFPRAGAGLPGITGAAIGALGAGALLTSSAGTGTLIGEAARLTAQSVGAGAVSAASAPGPFEFAARLPARAFYLYGCVPTRYKSSGDFDANSSEISVAEVEMQLDSFDEISLGALA